jgi:putative salt-induced outer membrane protein YdiY
MRRASFLFMALLGILPAAGASRAAEEAATAEKPPGPWSNSTELSLVVTDGNSNTEAFGLKNTLERKGEQGRTRLRIDALVSNKSDDPYLQVESGLTFEPGETITGFSTDAVRPAPEPDVERYFVEGRYEGNLPKKATWNSGASWDRNEDAGILNRTILFAGLGHVWQDREDLAFRTSYGISYTDREEEIPDPEKERRFPGARLTSDYQDKWGESTIYDNDFTFNINLQDASDYNFDLVQGVSVAMTKKLSLKVSLQFLYASEPALEEVDVIARVILVDPDLIPGNGDEFFQTVPSGGIELTIGEDTLRKKELDTTLRTSLLITF